MATPLAALAVAAILVLGVFAYSSLSARPASATKDVGTTSAASSSTGTEACSGYLPVWPSNQTGSIPVLLMQPGSTGLICVHYGYAGGDWNQNITSLVIGTEGCYGTNGTETCYVDPSGSFTTNGVLVSSPESLYETNVTVIYGVTASSNSTGFYEDSAPLDQCGAMPLAVGYPASQVNATDFPDYVSPASAMCFNIDYFPASVSVSGMTVTYLPDFGLSS